MNHNSGGGGFAGWLAGASADDPAALESALGTAAGNIEESGLDARTHALVRLAALVAAGDPEAGYDQQLCTALDHGVTPDEIVGMLVALLPAIGATCVHAVAPAILGAIDRVAAEVPGSPVRASD